MNYLRYPGQDRGKWNETKYKTLYLLSLRREKGQMEALSAMDLAYLTGVNPGSLWALLSKWVKWQYVARVYLPSGHYGYRILVKGRKFVEKAPLFLNVERYEGEIAEHQRQVGLLFC